jgi:hypothetical protein
MKINSAKSESQIKLRQIAKAGSVATRTKMTVKADEEVAKESNELLTRPSKYMQKFASAIKKLNSF